MNRAGYALLAVLWICTGIAALALVVSEAAREAVASSRNRIALTEASWGAQACLTHARAALASTFALAARVLGGDRSGAWMQLDQIARDALVPRQLHCTLSLRAVGSRLDVNAADEATLAALMRNIGVEAKRADSAAGALVAWRNAHGPFLHRRDLHALLTAELFTAIDSVLDVEPGPIALNHAAPAVLGLLPGFTPEVVERVVEARRRGAVFRAFDDLSRILDGEVRDVFDRGFAALAGTAVLQPSAWVVTARSTAGRPPVSAVVELRLVRADATSAITRRRSWIE